MEGLVSVISGGDWVIFEGVPDSAANRPFLDEFDVDRS